MAFNVFSSFRKYQRFWMAAVLLLCMITFVFCGFRGDFNDLLTMFGGGRRGSPVAKLNGYSIYRKDLEDLRTRRNVADIFMRTATRFAIHQLDEYLKNLDKIPVSERQDTELLWKGMREDLAKRLSRPRYFAGGVKYDDLINFMLWQQEADRLGVKLEQDAMGLMVLQEVYSRATGFDDLASRQVMNEVVRSGGYMVNDDLIFRALRDEFRVQTVQLALMEARPDRVLNPPGFESQAVRKAGGPFRNVSLLPEIRRPLAPEQLWEDYRKQCSAFDVALVPVPVSDFVKEVAAPTDKELQDFYESNRDNDFDPTIDRPSFKFPPRMKVQWVSADPKSTYYRKLSRAATTLESTPAIVWNPLLPAPLAALRYAAQSAAWDASLERNYEVFQRNQPERYLAPPLTAPNFLLELATIRAKTTPATIAALVGTAAPPGLVCAVPLTYQADVYFPQKKELALVLPALLKPRMPLAASIVLAGAASEWIPLGMWGLASRQDQFLPLDLVRDELREKIELNLAQKWTARVMLDVKKQLETPGTPGNKLSMELRLAELKEKYGLEVETTKSFHNRYDIDRAATLKPLLKSFEEYRVMINQIEGRGGTSQMLKEDDFWRLFFDSSIGFSVENAGQYVARPWPPYVREKRKDFGPATSALDEGQTIALFETSGHPFLFWQTAFEPARVPVSLDEVRDKVVAAWKQIQARDKLALPRAKAIALAVQGAGKDLRPVLATEAAKLGHEVITLRGVAPLVPLPSDNPQLPQSYGPYELPKNLFEYPRGDMVKELLALDQLSPESKEALKTGSRDLDDLNEELLKRKVAGKQVQVLTNRPRTFYYVAVVQNQSEANPLQFVFGIYMGASSGSMRGGFRDGFVALAQEEAGKAYRSALIEQLRRTADVETNKEAQTSFDGEGG